MRNRSIVIRTAVQRSDETVRFLKKTSVNNMRSFRYWFGAHTAYHREWEGDGSGGSGGWSRAIVPEE